MQNLWSGEKCVIMSIHVFGRDRDRVSTYVDGAAVSRIHASMIWKQDHWYFSDFSKNGTLINGKKIYSQGLKLTKGDVMQFGHEEADQWQIMDDSAPSSYLISRGAFHEIIVLNEQANQPAGTSGLQFHFIPEKGWFAQDEGKELRLLPGESYKLSGRHWLFVENELLSDTLDDLGDLSASYFEFHLSPDEEHIDLKLFVRSQLTDLGERAHNYLCLALARRRIEDIEAGYEPADQGWINTADLLADLSREQQQEVDVYYLNLQVHRFRQLLSKSQPYGFYFTEVLERRKNEIRFGHKSLVVIKEGSVVSDTR